MEKELRILLFGTGYAARRRVEAYRRIEGVKLVGAVCKTIASAEKFKAETGIETAWGIDAAEAIYKFSPDAADVCSPTETHLEIARAALSAGLSVFVEKPICSTAQEAAELAKLAESANGRTFAVSHTEVFSPAVNSLKKELAKRGKPDFINVLKADAKSLPPNAPDTAAWPESEVSGRLFDLLTHLISLALYTINEIEELVSGEPLTLAEKFKIEPYTIISEPGRECFIALLTTPGGIVLRLSQDNRGRGGTLVKKLSARADDFEIYWLLADGAEELRVREYGGGRRGGPEGRKIEFAGGDPFRLQVEDFVAAVKCGGKPAQGARIGALVTMLAIKTAKTLLSFDADAKKLAASCFASQKIGGFDAEKRNLLRQAIKRFDSAECKEKSLSPAFAASITRISADSKLKPYLLRFAAAKAELGELEAFRGEALEALLYSGVSAKELILRLDSRCNQRCLFCNVGGAAHKGLYVARDDARRTIERAPSDGFHRLMLSGGEPTLRPDICELIELAHRSGFDDITLQTNAVELARPAQTYLLKEAGLDMALVSLHSHIGKISDFLTAAKGTYEKTITGIKNLNSAGVGVRLVHVLTTANFKLLNRYLAFVNRELPFVSDVDILLDQHAGRGERRAFLVPKLSDVKPYLTDALKAAPSYGLRLNSALTIPPCFMGESPLNSLEYRRLKAFEAAGLEIDEQTETLKNDKIKGAQCADCLLDKYCLGVWKGYAKLYGTSELAPIKKL